ncbi:hypothetical protein MOE23_02450 [Bacillus haynesii]|uniref:hypothetical protein n=1 Tax=Bacillus haynesii TaxID=1925021 RepID=UPI0022828DEF|nr:hypothetical protein [Bacillus haynesii]MCY8579084.1 hypothetical protein [Bacillus haynesii]
MMKVVSFTRGAAGIYAGLRAIVTGNASGVIPFAQAELQNIQVACLVKGLTRHYDKRAAPSRIIDMKLGQEKLIKNRKILRAGSGNEKVLDAGSTFVVKIRGSIKWVPMILPEHAVADWFVFSESEVV